MKQKKLCLVFKNLNIPSKKEHFLVITKKILMLVYETSLTMKANDSEKLIKWMHPSQCPIKTRYKEALKELFIYTYLPLCIDDGYFLS